MSALSDFVAAGDALIVAVDAVIAAEDALDAAIVANREAGTEVPYQTWHALNSPRLNRQVWAQYKTNWTANH